MKFRYFILSLFLFASFGLQAKQIPAKPNPPKLVSDFAGVLSPGEQQALERKLVAYNDTTSTQIAIVIERSTEGDDIFDYSLRIAESWGIGRKGKDNGVLFYIAIDDRDLFIQNGYGVEGFFTDALARRVIENIIKPAFRQNQYYQGLDRATDVVIDAGSGEYTNDQSGKRDAKGGLPAIFVIVALLVIIVFISAMNSGDDDDDGGYYRGGRYDMDPYRGRRRRGGNGGWIFFPGSGGGSSWPGGGGGGFGGFGGGGFGGGGAGGSW